MNSLTVTIYYLFRVTDTFKYAYSVLCCKIYRNVGIYWTIFQIWGSAVSGRWQIILSDACTDHFWLRLWKKLNAVNRNQSCLDFLGHSNKCVGSVQCMVAIHPEMSMKVTVTVTVTTTFLMRRLQVDRRRITWSINVCLSERNKKQWINMSWDGAWMSASNATIWSRVAVYSTLEELRRRMLCLRTSDWSVYSRYVTEFTVKHVVLSECHEIIRFPLHTLADADCVVLSAY